MAKKHAPIQQLREAAKETERILRDRNIHTKDSAIAEIEAQNKTMLPGIPPYLPHRWSIQAARRIMADVVLMWVEETKGNMTRREDHREFFRFLIAQMAALEEAKKKEVDQMPEFLKALKGTVLLNRVFKPMQEMETAHTMSQFLVDAFAVAVICKQHDTVSDFVFWFDEWTTSLDGYWIREKNNG